MSTSGGFEDESFGSSSKKEIKKNSKKTLKGLRLIQIIFFNNFFSFK